MTEIIPAIIPESFEDLASHVARIKTLVKRVQIDILDGKYTPEPSWPYVNDQGEFKELIHEERGLPCWEDISYEFDLMIKHPEKVLQDWIRAGASACIIHAESTPSPQALIEMLHENEVQAGIALKPSSDIEYYAAEIENADFVQVMGNDEIGFHGVSLDPKVYDIFDMIHEIKPDAVIAVDIGVDFETAPELRDAGVTKLVSGSTIFGSEDIRETLSILRGEDDK